MSVSKFQNYLNKTILTAYLMHNFEINQINVTQVITATEMNFFLTPYHRNDTLTFLAGNHNTL
jgi:hypothetical protein